MSPRISARRGSSACSGAMYPTEPSIAPVPVKTASVESSLCILARPKSRIFTFPSRVTIRFDGLISRWTMPCSDDKLEPEGRLANELAPHEDGDRSLSLDEPSQVRPFDVLQHQCRPSSERLGSQGLHDVRMPQASLLPRIRGETARPGRDDPVDHREGTSRRPDGPFNRSSARKTNPIPPRPIMDFMR